MDEMEQLARRGQLELLGKLKQIRSDPVYLPNLRKTISSHLRAQRCTVVGSAPNIRIPKHLMEFPIVCANGSGWSIREHTRHTTVTVMGGYTTRGEKPNPKIVMEKIRGLSTDLVVFIEVGDECSHAEEALARADFRYSKMVSLSYMEVAAIVGLVLGEELGLGDGHQRLSMGMFAIVLAMWAVVQEIEFCGFSLKGGHSYTKEQTFREHVRGDARCFDLIRQFGVNARTTSIELSQSFGFPLSPAV